MNCKQQTFTYSIRIRGKIPLAWIDVFSDLTIENGEDKCGLFTQLSGEFSDQAALQGVLNHIYNLGLSLIALERLNECQTKENQEISHIHE
jgi:hypothetical protein